MKQSKIFIPTTKENPSDNETISNIYLSKGGFIKQLSAGVYSYLPLAKIIIDKIEKIIKDEMERIEAVEMLAPTLVDEQIWDQSGRLEDYGDLLFKTNDRKNRNFLLAPTHEESFTKIVGESIKSYKKLPIIVFQFQTKFRDEKRPKHGLLRIKEFIMKDAYSFSNSKESLDDIFNEFEKSYKIIFDKLDLSYKTVSADGTNMGSSDSKEFIAISNIGEDTIVYNDNYASNIEMAEFTNHNKTDINIFKLLVSDGKNSLLILPSNREINDSSINRILGTNKYKINNNFDNSLLNSFDNFDNIFIDKTLDKNNSVNINEENIYLNGISDEMIEESFTLPMPGDKDKNDIEELNFVKGIELGHIFKLGTKYSEIFNASIQNENEKKEFIEMGSYGIGISRLIPAIAEQHNDDKGLIWPKSVSPFDVHIIQMNMNDENQNNLTKEIESKLKNKSISFLTDDRNERPGIKFAESDLIGIPVRIIVGKKSNENIVEIKDRKTGEVEEVGLNEIIEKIS